MMIAIPLLLALVGINLLTVLTFAHDKGAAIRGDRRIRESTLLRLAAIGGSPGALWARRRYRHKTRKQPFATYLDLIAMVHAGLALGLATLLI